MLMLISMFIYSYACVYVIFMFESISTHLPQATPKVKTRYECRADKGKHQTFNSCNLVFNVGVACGWGVVDVVTHPGLPEP